MTKRLPDVVETFASSVSLTWWRATVAEPPVFGYTNRESQTIPQGAKGWAMAQGTGWWLFVPEELGDWPERCVVFKSALEIGDEFRHATYTLPAYYWESFTDEEEESDG